MQKMLAALYVNGKVVTGTHHADAFSKLSNDDKEGEICSGFLDQQCGKFVCEDSQFYLKKIVMIRHAEAGDGDDPEITTRGRTQTQRTASFLKSFVDLKEYTALTSPRQRCRQTAELLQDDIGLEFNIDENLVDDDFGSCNFDSRLSSLLNQLPSKSFLISHCNFITYLAQLATGSNSLNLNVSNCSITFIENCHVTHIGCINEAFIGNRFPY